jgi:hypothetical protein
MTVSCSTNENNKSQLPDIVINYFFQFSFQNDLSLPPQQLNKQTDAWNGQLNPKKRNVKLEHRDCCCCAIGVDVVSPQGIGLDPTPLTVSLLATPLKNCSSWTWYFSLLLQILFSITIICIIALQLSVRPTGEAGVPGTTQLTSECLLGVDSKGNSLCVYSYVAAGVSIVCSFTLVLLAVSFFLNAII